jgi:hypothetical protein
MRYIIVITFFNVSAYFHNNVESFLLLLPPSLACDAEGTKELIHNALHHETSEMVKRVWQSNPKVLRDVVLNSEETNIIDMFKLAGSEEKRIEIFALLVQDEEFAKVMKASKSQIVRDICCRGHDKLFGMFIKQFSMSAMDICGERGISSVHFLPSAEGLETTFCPLPPLSPSRND